MNERATEEFVRKQLRDLSFYDGSVKVEEQQSSIEDIQKLLRKASKTGGSGSGFPEFIITDTGHPDFVLVIECKASIKFHKSPQADKPKGFAVDGALHYAKHLSRGYNVIAIAVSGKEENSKISVFLHPRAGQNARTLTNEYETEISEIIPFREFVRHGSFDREVREARHKNLMQFSRELHVFMRDHAKLTESEKPLLVSGTLIALKNKAFAKSFGEHRPEDLQTQWYETIKNELDRAEIPNSKRQDMAQPYSSIAVHPELRKSKPKFPKGVLHELIKRLYGKVWPFISYYKQFDVVGQFYGEFLKYTGGDKKSLGIVLTPRHITELFADITGINQRSKVLDICAGTGGFLISAMNSMLETAQTDEEIQKIKKHNLIGVEQQPGMFALAASNMILRGDGKANLYHEDCFEPKLGPELESHECNVGLLNPPYSQREEGLHEFDFIDRMLDLLVPGAIGAAIVPMPLAIKKHALKSQILSKHTLDAVMSLPDDLFDPVATVPL